MSVSPGGGANAAPTEPPPAAPEPSTVHWGIVERKAADEAGAKAALATEIARVKSRISEACQRDHESFGSCVATKFSSQAAVLAQLGFTARKEVEKALTDECREQVGTCLGVVSTDPVCVEKVEVQPTPPANEKEKKADGKKK